MKTAAQWRNPRTVWLGTASFAYFAIAAALVHRLFGPGNTVAVAMIYGLGTVGTAWITAGPSGYPFWSWLGTSVMMGLALVLSASMFPDSRSAHHAVDMAWLYPWYFLFMGVTPPRACAPRAPIAGAVLFGMGLFYTMILVGAAWLTRG